MLQSEELFFCFKKSKCSHRKPPLSQACKGLQKGETATRFHRDEKDSTNHLNSKIGTLTNPGMEEFNKNLSVRVLGEFPSNGVLS